MPHSEEVSAGELGERERGKKGHEQIYISRKGAKFQGLTYEAPTLRPRCSQPWQRPAPPPAALATPSPLACTRVLQPRFRVARPAPQGPAPARPRPRARLGGVPGRAAGRALPPRPLPPTPRRAHSAPLRGAPGANPAAEVRAPPPPAAPPRLPGLRRRRRHKEKQHVRSQLLDGCGCARPPEPPCQGRAAAALQEVGAPCGQRFGGRPSKHELPEVYPGSVARAAVCATVGGRGRKLWDQGIR